jgi:hypothetical protein
MPYATGHEDTPIVEERPSGLDRLTLLIKPGM